MNKIYLVLTSALLFGCEHYVNDNPTPSIENTGSRLAKIWSTANPTIWNKLSDKGFYINDAYDMCNYNSCVFTPDGHLHLMQSYHGRNGFSMNEITYVVNYGIDYDVDNSAITFETSITTDVIKSLDFKWDHILHPYRDMDGVVLMYNKLPVIPVVTHINTLKIANIDVFETGTINGKPYQVNGKTDVVQTTVTNQIELSLFSYQINLLKQHIDVDDNIQTLFFRHYPDSKESDALPSFYKDKNQNLEKVIAAILRTHYRNLPKA